MSENVWHENEKLKHKLGVLQVDRINVKKHELYYAIHVHTYPSFAIPFNFAFQTDKISG